MVLKGSLHVKKHGLWFAVFLLVMIEQGIKVIINSKYLAYNVAILEPWFYFKPMFNRDYSWFNSMLQLGIGRWFHSLLVLVFLVVIFLIYRNVKKQIEMPLLVSVMFAFIFAGAMCSLIDKVYWNGSLDYILVKGFFTFDLKDVYLNIFNGLLILVMVTDYKGLRSKLL
jgi:signal peptidase II